MAKTRDPFSGMKLSQQVGLDQRLFSEQSSPAAESSKEEVSQEPSFPGNKEPSQEVGKEAGQEGVKEGSLQDIPILKNSFLFTEEEWDLLDDIKLDLRRRFGLKATKNDLARAGVRLLADDYQEKKEASFLVRKLPKK